VAVCRGGDCGSRHKHPDTDHRDQLGRFRDALGRDLVVSRCLDACEHSNVVVVVPHTPGGREKDEPVWVGEVNDPETTADLLDWISAGAVIDSQDLPVLVQIRRFSPTRRNRQELETELRAD
jgi:(2Fe-2S) ferredoxin